MFIISLEASREKVPGKDSMSCTKAVNLPSMASLKASITPDVQGGRKFRQAGSRKAFWPL